MGIIEDRRALHRIPELEWELPKTMAYLKNALADLNCLVFEPVPGALCAWFDFEQETAIAFRADADALPIAERNDCAFVSAHPGKMHACGHDGHMAIALELARRLSQKKTLPHNVLLIFQPGEESPGGAKIICDTGVLESHNVQAVFGLHLWPGLEPGRMFTRQQELMSHSSEMTIDVYGKSAHLAKADQGIDALAAAVELYTRVRQTETALPRHLYRLMNFGLFQSGTVRNAVSRHTHLEGTLRAFQDEVFDGLQNSLYAITADIQQKYGCTIQIHFSEGYPAVMNPPALCEKLHTYLDFGYLEDPTMTSEDFSWYQRHVPGVFFFLGLGDVPALHSDNFQFDESILAKGADFFEKLAEHYQ